MDDVAAANAVVEILEICAGASCCNLVVLDAKAVISLLEILEPE